MKQILPMGCDRIYKYQPYNLFSLDNILKHQIWFSNPKILNDPFDGSFPSKIQEPTDKEWEFITEKILNKRYPHEISSTEYSDLTLLSKKSEEFKKLVKSIAISKLLERFFPRKKVACFSKTAKNLLMWSHYAEGHHGFCLEFDGNLEPFLGAEDVKYDEVSLPFSIDDIFSGQIEDTSKILFYKRSIWVYEQELRITIDEKKETFPYSSNALKAIYFGIKMSNEYKRTLTILMNKMFPQVTVFDTRGSISGYFYWPVKLDNNDDFVKHKDYQFLEWDK